MFQKPDKKEEYIPNADNGHGKDEVETVVGPSVNVEGDFSSEGNIVVKGTVSGSVNTSRLLTVEEGAKIFANIKAGNAYISGSIKGSVRVSERLELTATAQISGDIACKILSVESGALVQGKVNMKGIEIDNKESKKSLGVKTRIKSNSEKIATV